MLSPAVSPVSVGVSKSGAVLNVSTPPDELMLNFPPSPADSTDHDSVVDASTSDAAKSTTVPVPFSGTEAVVALVVITGASLTLVTVTVTVCVSLS